MISVLLSQLGWIILLIFIVMIFSLGIRIVRPTEKGLIERLGKFQRVADQGFHWIIPVIDRMVKVNVTENMVDVEPQKIITKDDLNATVDAVVYFRVLDPKKAVYQAQNYRRQISSLARTTLRDIIGKMTLTEANSKRDDLNKQLEKELDIQTDAWGIDIIRVELQRIEPPEDVQGAMNKVVIAERDKKAAIDFACYSADTRVLTEDGFKYHWEVNGGKILCFNYQMNLLEYQKPNKLYEYDVEDEDIIHFKGKTQDFLITPKHTMYVSTGKNNFSIKKALDVENYSKIIVKNSAEWNGVSIKTITIPSVKRGQGWNDETNPLKLNADDMLEFIGYYIADGGLSVKDGKEHKQYTLKFTLKKKEKQEKIISCINRLGFKYLSYENKKKPGTLQLSVNGKQLWNYFYNNFGGYSYEKYIPRKFLNLSKQQLQILFDALMLCDGSINKKENRNSMSYSTVSPQLAEDVQELALKLGYSTKVSDIPSSSFQLKAENPKHCKIILMSKNIEKHLNNINREKYSGKIYCFSTDAGFYVTERNGCIAIQGNTATETKADGERRAEIKRAEGVKQSRILEAEGESEYIVKVANAKATEIEKVNTAIQTYFKDQAEVYKKLETIQFSLKDNTKFVIDPNTAITNVIAEQMAGIVPIKDKNVKRNDSKTAGVRM